MGKSIINEVPSQEVRATSVQPVSHLSALSVGEPSIRRKEGAKQCALYWDRPEWYLFPLKCTIKANCGPGVRTVLGLLLGLLREYSSPVLS